MGSRLGRAARSIAAALALVAAPARAAFAPDGPEPEPPALTPPTFSYVRPEPAHPWRALVEDGGVMAITFVFYAARPLPAPEANPYTLWQKLRLAPGAFALDADPLPVNYVGHPVAGMYYYQLARGNRLGVWPSAAIAAASGLTWELIEYQEPAAVNDVISTAVGGVALGEAFTQLGACLERRGGLVARFLALIANQPKWLNDRIDRAEPREGPPAGWDRLTLAVAGGEVKGGGGSSRQLRVGAGSRIVRVAGYGAAGRSSEVLGDGNVSALSLRMAWGSRTISEVDALAEASVAGAYLRSIGEDGRGQDLLATLAAGWDYQRRSAAPAGGDPYDYLVLVRFPTAALQYRVLLGDAALELGAAAALSFGAVQPYPLLGAASSPPGVPGVVAAQGYYHGLGFMAAPRIAVEAGALTASASARLDRLWGLVGGDVTHRSSGQARLEDRRADLDLAAAWRTPWTGTELGLAWQRHTRWGRADELARSGAESRLLLQLEAVL